MIVLLIYKAIPVAVFFFFLSLPVTVPQNLLDHVIWGGARHVHQSAANRRLLTRTAAETVKDVVAASGVSAMTHSMFNLWPL